MLPEDGAKVALLPRGHAGAACHQQRQTCGRRQRDATEARMVSPLCPAHGVFPLPGPQAATGVGLPPGGARPDAGTATGGPSRNIRCRLLPIRSPPRCPQSPYRNESAGESGVPVPCPHLGPGVAGSRASCPDDGAQFHPAAVAHPTCRLPTSSGLRVPIILRRKDAGPSHHPGGPSRLAKCMRQRQFSHVRVRLPCVRTGSTRWLWRLQSGDGRPGPALRRSGRVSPARCRE